MFSNFLKSTPISDYRFNKTHIHVSIPDDWVITSVSIIMHGETIDNVLIIIGHFVEFIIYMYIVFSR